MKKIWALKNDFSTAFKYPAPAGQKWNDFPVIKVFNYMYRKDFVSDGGFNCFQVSDVGNNVWVLVFALRCCVDVDVAGKNFVSTA